VALSSVVGELVSNLIEGLSSEIITVLHRKQQCNVLFLMSSFDKMCVFVIEDVKMQRSKIGASVCWKNNNRIYYTNRM